MSCAETVVKQNLSDGVFTAAPGWDRASHDLAAYNSGISHRCCSPIFIDPVACQCVDSARKRSDY